MSIEPLADVVGDGHTHEANCLNCGAALGGAFCSACGQHAHVHRTLAAFFHDFLHGVFHFEGKVWRTLPMLAWRPGELTRRYIDGQRASFLSPMALFLFSVFLMFAVLHSVGTPIDFGNSDKGAFKIETSMREDIPKLQADLSRQQKMREAAVRAHRPTTEIDSKIAESEEGIRVINEMQTKGIGVAMADAAARDAAKGKAAKARGAAQDKPFNVESDFPMIQKAWDRARGNPQLALFQLQSSAYKYSWLMIPLSLPFMWLLFPFSRRFRLYDHSVFVTYSLSFMTLLVCAAALGVAAGWMPVLAAAVLFVPFHMYRQLRGTYDLGRWSGIARTALLLVFGSITLTLFGLAMIALGVFE